MQCDGERRKDSGKYRRDRKNCEEPSHRNDESYHITRGCDNRTATSLARIPAQTRKIITSVALMRAAAVCPGFSCISRADRAVMMDVIC